MADPIGPDGGADFGSDADLVVRGGTVVDAGGSRVADVVVRGGRIVAVGSGAAAGVSAQRVVDADGLLVLCGLVDLHARLGAPDVDPHHDEPEVPRALAAAAAGGFTTVVAHPDAATPLERASALRALQHAATTTPGGAPRVRPMAALLAAPGAADGGTQLAPHGELLGAGAVGFAVPDAGGVDSGLVRNALRWAAHLGVPVALGGADPGLARGVVHEGEVAARLGLSGVPAEAEELAVLRAVALARLTGAWVHLSTVSTAGSVAIVRGAKAEGIAVSAEVALHHLVLDDTACAGFEPATRVSPPLRPGAHVEALRAAVADGTVDAVVTHHRPLRPADKEAPFAEATPGIEAFETAFAVALNHSGLDVVDVLAAMSWRPAALLGAWDLLGGRPVEPEATPPGQLVAGAPADLVVVDPAATVTVAPWPLAAHVAPHPYVGWQLAGRIVATVADGECIFMQNRG